MNTRELAEYLGVKQQRVHHLRYRFGLPFKMMTGKTNYYYEYDPKEVNEWVEKTFGDDGEIPRRGNRKYAARPIYHEPAPDPCRPLEYPAENCKTLLAAIVIQAIKDFKHGTRGAKRSARRFLESPALDELTQYLEITPDYIRRNLGIK